jgi:hypothetical protein
VHARGDGIPGCHSCCFLLQLADGVGDLFGKLLPVWSPRHPHATIFGKLLPANPLLAAAAAATAAAAAAAAIFLPAVAHRRQLLPAAASAGKWHWRPLQKAATCPQNHNLLLLLLLTRSCLQWPLVGSWYPLLLQLADGVGDLCGKLLPVWSPRHPHATITAIGCSRLLFIPVFILGLLLAAGPAFFFVFTFLVNLTAW